MGRSVSDLLRHNYPLVAKDLLGPMLDVLVTAHATFDGDIEKLILLLAVALRTAEHSQAADIDMDAVLNGAVASIPSLTTNMRSVSDSTGIPKETARRKIRGLIDDGWILRQGNDLSLTPHGSQQLTPVRDALLKLAERYDQAIGSLAHNADAR
jgi:hypothetical protein